MDKQTTSAETESWDESYAAVNGWGSCSLLHMKMYNYHTAQKNSFRMLFKIITEAFK